MQSTSESTDFEPIFAAVPLPCLLLDPEFGILAANDRYLAATLRTADDIVGRGLFDAFPDNPRDRDANGVSNLRASLQTVLKTRKPHKMAVQKYDIQTAGDGSQFEVRYWDPMNVPVLDANGNVTHIIHTVSDVTDTILLERKNTEALADQENSTRLLLDTAPGGFYCVDTEGNTTLSNLAFLRMLGFSSSRDVIGRKLHDIIHHTHPDGSHYAKEDCPIYRCARSGEGAHVIDECFYKLDGTAIAVEYWVSPIMQRGDLKGAVCTFNDVTERKAMEDQRELAEEQRTLLTRELEHRGKNTLSLVQAIVGQSLRNALSPADATTRINERLSALGHAQDLLTQKNWRGAPIADVVSRAVLVHQEPSPRIEATGPQIQLSAKSALSLALAVHELCTNAAKYGALSNATGSVRVSWNVEDGEVPQLNLQWLEQGGPVVAVPTHSGFGSRLVSNSFGADAGGSAELLFEPEGVIWRVKVPLTAING